MDSNLKKLKFSFILLFSTILFGTVGYNFSEGMSLFDSFYMTIITISTVGFKEVVPLSNSGRVIAILIISFGITIGAYTIGSFLRFFIEGELRKTYGRRQMEKKISKLKDHYIICGYGRIGKLICQELKEHNIDFVVIESDLEVVTEIEHSGYLYIPMDATSDESLIKAGLNNARGLVAAVMSDANNVFITLTARGLNPDIFILSRASEGNNEVKLKRAGATRVVSPYLIGGKRMAQVLIRPTVVDFIDIAMMENHLGLKMEEACVKPGSKLIGKNLIESNLRKDFGVILVLIKKFNGDMIFNPQPTEILEENDMMVILGENDNMDRLKESI